MANSHLRIQFPLCFLCIGLLCTSASAAHLVDVRTVDDEIVMVYWHDAEVEYKDTGTGPTAFKGLDSAGEVIHKFDPPLDTAAAVDPKSYSLVSTTDANYAAAGANPVSASRKTKSVGPIAGGRTAIARSSTPSF